MEGTAQRGSEEGNEVKSEPSDGQMLVVPGAEGQLPARVDPTEELEARIGAILAALEKAERQRARELMVMLFEWLAECDPVTVAAYKPRILRTLGIPSETFRGMLRAARQKQARRQGTGMGRERYGIVNGRICALEYEPTAREMNARPLCNFSARIVRENL